MNNSNQPGKSSGFHFAPANYSPLFQVKNGCGEQVVFWKLTNPSKQRHQINAIGYDFDFEFSGEHRIDVAECRRWSPALTKVSEWRFLSLIFRAFAVFILQKESFN